MEMSGLVRLAVLEVVPGHRVQYYDAATQLTDKTHGCGPG